MENLKSAERILNASTEGRGAEASRCLRQQTQSSRMYTEVHSWTVLCISFIVYKLQKSLPIKQKFSLKVGRF